MIRKLMLAVSALLLSAAGSFGQAWIGGQGGVPGNPQQQSYQHRVGGVFQALGYSNWQAVILSGNTTTGSGVSIVVYPQGAQAGGGVTLADGAVVPLPTVFNTLTKLTIDFGQGNQEYVTPTSVSFGLCPVGNLGVGGTSTCATITGTFNNTHGQSAIVTSGDFGIGEAITDAGNQGGGVVYWIVDTGIVTLNTGGLTTTTNTTVPTNFYNFGGAARVTTTITTTTNWAIGISGATGIFCSANATLTAGTTCLANQVAPATTGTTSAMTALLITTTVANPGAGALKARVWGYTPVQPTS